VDTLRVVIADDHPVWRSGLRHELGEGFEIVAEAANAVEAIDAIEATRPDVVACDVFMPDGGGISVVHRCASEAPIVMVSSSAAERDVLDCVVAGAVGYMLKTTSGDELRSAMRRAAKRDGVFSPDLAGLVLAEFRRLGQQSHSAQSLTDREREVLVGIAKGRTYRQIGESLFISPKTVENHTRRILHKLHLTRRDELARYAIKHGLDT
jgi:DNA-binding NarL/FixJ family response regulator